MRSASHALDGVTAQFLPLLKTSKKEQQIRHRDVPPKRGGTHFKTALPSARAAAAFLRL